MAFVISNSDNFSYVVTIPKLQDDGSISRHKVTMKFKRLSTDDLMDYQEKDADLSRLPEALEKANGDKELAFILMSIEDRKNGKQGKRVDEMVDDLMQILCGWEEVSDESGKLDFCRENLAKLLQFSAPAYRAINEAFREAASGDGKRKN